MENHSIYAYYLSLLDVGKSPSFLSKYLEVPCLVRLKEISYFCGMDYASKDIYDFKEYVTRFDHSLSVALLTWKFTKSKKATLAGLFHDVATPCFSHVIDYMNQDYETQESTEEFTLDILKKDQVLKELLEEDSLKVEDIAEFKRYTIVDNDRPKLCADRLDGLILTGAFWTKSLTKEDIKKIIEDVCVYSNAYGEKELGFKDKEIALQVVRVSKEIDVYCHSKEDNYMMQLLASITREAIDNHLIAYMDLFYKTEKEILSIVKKSTISSLCEKMLLFETIKKEEVEDVFVGEIKVRKLFPLVLEERVCVVWE